MSPYPRPGKAGGGLIRSVLRLFKRRGLSTPLKSPILIAVSGGVDSMVLAHLAGTYGRRLIDPALVTLLHLDHGWRTESSNEEPQAVEDLARQLGFGFRHVALKAPSESKTSGNLEEDARNKRLEVYDLLSGPDKEFRFVLTAHHRDDVAETVLWRFLRGELLGGIAGIKFLDSQCLRPFLEVSKEQIEAYAQEEGVPHFEDPTNLDSTRFRAWARKEMLPFLETRYPSIRKTLAGYANPQSEVSQGVERSSEMCLVNIVQAVVGGPLNRAQRAALSNMLRETSPGQALSLPGGGQLKRLKTGWLIEDSSSDNQV